MAAMAARHRAAKSHPRGPSVLPPRTLRLLKWVLPLFLGNLGIYLLLSGPKDGMHCTVFLPKEARVESSAFSPTASHRLLQWAVQRGLRLNPAVELGLLPDASYSGSEHAREDAARLRALERGKVTWQEGRRHSRAQLLDRGSRTGAELVEHGWGLAGGNRRPSVRGVMARRPMSTGDSVCILPLSLALTAGNASSKATSTTGADSGGKPRLPADVEALAVALLKEKSKGVSSLWAPYIESLPRSVPLPITLLPENLRLLQWGWTQERVRKMQRDIQGSFDRLVNSGNSSAGPDFTSFLWAVSIVHSRAFRIPLKGQEEEENQSKGREGQGELVLMPFMDAFNHHFRNQMDWMEKPISNDGTLEMVLKKPVVRGQQIFTTFGPRSNDDLFLYYGFLLDSNPFDSLALFSSFQDAAKWFVDSLQFDCDSAVLGKSTPQPGTRLNISALCPRVPWEEVQAAATKGAAVSSAPKGLEREGEDWKALLAEWGQLGYEVLPYRPGPNVKPGGVVDPTLLSVFSGVLDLWTVPLPAWRYPPCPVPSTRAASATKAGRRALHGMSCCRGLRGDLQCPGVADEKSAARADYIRMAVVRRSREILVSLPTSVAEDRRFLDDITFKSADGSGVGCSVGTNQISEAWVLSIRYRLQKKEMLLEVIHQYSSS